MLSRLRRQPYLLDRYWSALRRDTRQPATPPSSLDPDIADFAARLSAGIDQQGAGIAFRVALRQRIDARIETKIGSEHRAWSGPALDTRRRPAPSSQPASSSDKDTTMPEMIETPQDSPISLHERRWTREVLKIAAAALVFGLIGALLALTLRGDDSEPNVVAPGPTPEPTTAPVSPTPSDPLAGTVLATIPVGVLPWDIAAGAGAIWVPNGENGTVSRIDPDTNQVVAVIPIGTKGVSDAPNPWGAAVLGDEVWVANAADGQLVRIDPATNEVASRVLLPNVTPGSIRALAAGAGSIWISDTGSGNLIRFDPATETVVATINVAGLGLAVTDDAVWVADYWDNQVVRVDPATNEVVAQIKFKTSSGLLEGPRQVAVGAGGVWVTTRYGDALVRIDPATNQIIATVEKLDVYGSQAKVGSPWGVVVDASGVWLAGGNATGLYLIDPATNQQIGAMPMPVSYSMVVSDGSLWVSNARDDTITRVDPTP